LLCFEVVVLTIADALCMAVQYLYIILFLDLVFNENGEKGQFGENFEAAPWLQIEGTRTQE
jgi:hypothetical protein